MKVELTAISRDGPSTWTAEVEGGLLPAGGEATTVLGAGVPITVRHGDTVLPELEWRKRATSNGYVEGIHGRGADLSFIGSVEKTLAALSVLLRLGHELTQELHRLGVSDLAGQAVLREDRLVLTLGEITCYSRAIELLACLRGMPETTPRHDVLRIILLLAC